MRAVPSLHGCWYLSGKVLLTWAAPSTWSAWNKPELLCPVGAPGIYNAATAFGGLISSSSVMDPPGLSTSSPLATRQMPVSLRGRCHATRSVMTSWAALRGVPPCRHLCRSITEHILLHSTGIVVCSHWEEVPAAQYLVLLLWHTGFIVSQETCAPSGFQIKQPGFLPPPLKVTSINCRWGKAPMGQGNDVTGVARQMNNDLLRCKQGWEPWVGVGSESVLVGVCSSLQFPPVSEGTIFAVETLPENTTSSGTVATVSSGSSRGHRWHRPYMYLNGTCAKFSVWKQRCQSARIVALVTFGSL